MNLEIKILLDEEATRINRPDFIDNDPVQFPRRFNDIRDIEITSFLVSSIAWGNRKMILRDAEKMLALMEANPYAYVMDNGYEELPDGQNIHRTFFTQDFKYFLRGLHAVYTRYNSVDELNSHLSKIGDNDAPWKLVEHLNRLFADANAGGVNNRCFPQNVQVSALKRVNMALRWLVRDDGIVDMGVWRSMRPAQLYIPLDVHVGNVSRGLEILTRRSNDRKAVVELTNHLREIRPEDPVFYDYALFGLGVSGRAKEIFQDF
ncbi:MAG: TIGR02757 family protein [Muribaculaceae bacterium]|nr:TIGR02757 family protein [Muribaculaceae bacterium]